MTPSTETTRMVTKLNEQLQFVQRSSDAYDRGVEEEALQIATHIAYLGFDHKKMLSSSRGHGDWKDYLAHEINPNSPTPIQIRPNLGENFHELSIEDWWKKETVFVHGGTNHSRSKIILSAANTDGGAHVDSELEHYYEFLCAGEYLFGFTGSLEYSGPPPFPQGVTIYPKNAHFALIR